MRWIWTWILSWFKRPRFKIGERVFHKGGTFFCEVAGFDGDGKYQLVEYSMSNALVAREDELMSVAEHEQILRDIGEIE